MKEKTVRPELKGGNDDRRFCLAKARDRDDGSFLVFASD